MRDTLRAEVTDFLQRQGPSVATEIAIGVRARRADVEAVLAAGGFRPAERPEGAHPRGIYFEVSPEPSRPVPATLGGKSRARALLDVLEDGRRHTRDDIFRLTGRFFLTNNAAAELRRAGYDVRHEQDGDVHLYWLGTASQTEPEATPLPDTPPAVTASPVSGSVGEAQHTRLFETPAETRGATRTEHAA